MISDTSTQQPASPLRERQGLQSLLEGKSQRNYIGYDSPWHRRHSTLPNMRNMQSIPSITSPLNVVVENDVVRISPSLMQVSWLDELNLLEKRLITERNPFPTSLVDCMTVPQNGLEEVTVVGLAGANAKLRPRRQITYYMPHQSPVLAESDEVFDEIMTDLDEVMEEADEESYTRPTSIALDNARHLLRKLYTMSPMRYEVYPTPYAEIAIDAPGRGCSVMVLCDSKGGATCIVNLPDGYSTKHDSSINVLPNEFLLESLARIRISVSN